MLRSAGVALAAGAGSAAGAASARRAPMSAVTSAAMAIALPAWPAEPGSSLHLRAALDGEGVTNPSCGRALARRSSLPRQAHRGRGRACPTRAMAVPVDSGWRVGQHDGFPEPL